MLEIPPTTPEHLTGRPNWRHVGAFLGLTFGFTWLLDLLIYWHGGLGTPGSLSVVQLQMLFPAFSAIVLGMFFFPESPLYFPRTNNALEQYFGSARYHERRITGRKQASPSLVVRGAVRVVASVASRLHPFSGTELCPADLTQWRALRSELHHRHEARRLQHRFRKAPESYLATLEEKLSKERLPT